jgi:hypothetical protein
MTPTPARHTSSSGHLLLVFEHCYCLYNKLHCIIVADRSLVLHVLTVFQTKSFLQEDKIMNSVREASS